MHDFSPGWIDALNKRVKKERWLGGWVWVGGMGGTRGVGGSYSVKWCWSCMPVCVPVHVHLCVGCVCGVFCDASPLPFKLFAHV